MSRVSRLGNTLWQQHKPLRYLTDDVGTRTCLILLNQPLEKSILKQIWQSSLIKVCTDGGINRLNSAVKEDSDRYIPDVISGDFDSASRELLSHYENKGSLIVATPDQDETDFTKGLHVMLDTLTARESIEDYECIICLGAFGGRFDHTMANINTLYKARELQKKPIYLLSPTQVASLLQPGSHIIQLDTGYEGDWCGLLPVGGAANQVYTTGLKWNLDGERLAFGSLVSSSNTFEQNSEVTVETTEPLVWVMGVNYKC